MPHTFTDSYGNELTYYTEEEITNQVKSKTQ